MQSSYSDLPWTVLIPFIRMFEKFPEAGNSPSPFLGSGTTLAAAEATQRVCYGIVAMRVCGRFPNSPARARQLYWGWSTFAPRPDGGVLALSFVTALIARPWKVGVHESESMTG